RIVHRDRAINLIAKPPCVIARFVVWCECSQRLSLLRRAVVVLRSIDADIRRLTRQNFGHVGVVAVLIQIDAPPIARLRPAAECLSNNRTDEHLAEDRRGLLAVGNLVDVAYDTTAGEAHIDVIGDRSAERGPDAAAGRGYESAGTVIDVDVRL